MDITGFGRNAAPFLYGGEAAAIAQVLDTGQFGHGPVTEEFEKAIADFLGVPDAVAVSTCTAALQIALTTAGIGPGDEVVVPSMTFCATVQAILASGAHPRFAEINPDTLCVDHQSVKDALTPHTRAVVPVLYGGRAVGLDALRDDLAERNITVVEDAAHAFGSRRADRFVGATDAVTCFSFGPIKNLTCGQGGAVIPATARQADQARTMRMVGMTATAAERARSTAYDVDGIGLRAHMSQLNAAIGLAQMENFAKAQATRKALWRTYAEALARVDGAVLVDVDVDQSVPSLCVVKVPSRDRVFESMRTRGIGVGVHYPPNHQQTAFSPWHRPLPITEAVAGQILTLPFHQHMTERDVKVVAQALEEALA
ncbi:DegT/DnrJ/EryC1/StrS family aminotransferase [Streptomyces sp. NPDC006711]|uniref:DegT/DnrJ/EryC1/StrS family aminotransferase n=1 Tax=Streptomyces sp. NPDC006711 TaxID=3364762 RepID=UPI00368DD1B9